MWHSDLFGNDAAGGFVYKRSNNLAETLTKLGIDPSFAQKYVMMKNLKQIK